MPGLTTAIRSRILRFRREVVVMGYALIDPETPTRLRIASLAVLLYLVSPFDLLPELIPVVGILDDLALVPWAIAALVRRLPARPRAEAEASADRFLARYLTRPLTFVAALLVALLVLWALVIWLVSLGLR